MAFKSIGDVEIDKYLKDRSMIRVAVLTCSYQDSDSVFKLYDSQEVDIERHNPNKRLYQFDVRFVGKWPTPARQQLAELVDSGLYDVFLNLCDGMPGDGTAGVEVIDYLNRRRVVLASANSKFYGMSKKDMKIVANSCDVPTPAYVFVDADDIVDENVDEIVDTLAFPLIVKHHNGCGSLGMTENSKVAGKPQLIAEIKKTVAEMGGALVEEFITGREFTVLVAENPYDPNSPIVYDPMECRLPSVDSFKHFDMKFINTRMEWIPVDDPPLADRLKSMTSTMFLGCHGNSYGRCDFRACQRTGTIYCLEINAQCGVFYEKPAYGSADFILEKCHGHRTFLENLLLCAYADHCRANEKDSVAVLPVAPSNSFEKSLAHLCAEKIELIINAKDFSKIDY